MTMTFALDRGVTLERRYKAPPEMVFEAWTRPEHLGWFFNPGQPVDEPATVDLRVGGQWRQMMVIDATTRYWTGGIYREIDPPRRLVIAWGAVDGWPRLDPARLDETPQIVVQLEPDGEGTRMRASLEFPAHFDDRRIGEWRALGVEDGWRQTVDRLKL